MTKTLIKKQLMEVFAWLYRALMGIVSVTLGVFGSVFNTFSTLYQAKDNDLLFAMPITERSVLTIPMNLLKSRGVFARGLHASGSFISIAQKETLHHWRELAGINAF